MSASALNSYLHTTTVDLYYCVLVSQSPRFPASRRHAVACTSIVCGPCPRPGMFAHSLITHHNAVGTARYLYSSCRDAARSCASCCCPLPLSARSTIHPCSRVYELTLIINKYSNNTGSNDTSSPLNFAESPPYYPSPYVQISACYKSLAVEVGLTGVGKSEGAPAPPSFHMRQLHRDTTELHIWNTVADS